MQHQTSGRSRRGAASRTPDATSVAGRAARTPVGGPLVPNVDACGVCPVGGEGQVR